MLTDIRALADRFLIALPNINKREPLDQTDIDWTVVLDPLGRWNVVCEKSPDWSTDGGGRLGPQGGRPGRGPFRPLLRSRGF